MPNVTATSSGQNFHYVTSAASSSDTVILRLVHNFGASSSPGIGPFVIGGGGAGGAGGGRRRSQNNINFGLNWSRSSNNIVNPFPSLAGGTGTQGLNASAGWTYGKGRVTNIFRVNYNHNHVSTTNLYSNVIDVSGPGGAGIGGSCYDPFYSGLARISFTSFGGVGGPPTPRPRCHAPYISATVHWNARNTNHGFRGSDH